MFIVGALLLGFGVVKFMLSHAEASAAAEPLDTAEAPQSGRRAEEGSASKPDLPDFDAAAPPVGTTVHAASLSHGSPRPDPASSKTATQASSGDAHG